jgi:hypothetical protein
MRCLPLGYKRSGSVRLAATPHRHRPLQLTQKDRDWHPQCRRLSTEDFKSYASRSDCRSPMNSCPARPQGAAYGRKSRHCVCGVLCSSARAISQHTSLRLFSSTASRTAAQPHPTSVAARRVADPASVPGRQQDPATDRRTPLRDRLWEGLSPLFFSAPRFPTGNQTSWVEGAQMNHHSGPTVQPRADACYRLHDDVMPIPKACVPTARCHLTCPACPCSECRSLSAASGGGLPTQKGTSSAGNPRKNQVRKGRPPGVLSS